MMTELAIAGLGTALPNFPIAQSEVCDWLANRLKSIGKTSWVFRNADNLHYVKRLEGHGNLSRSGS
jgi:hypothetical protein